MSTNDVVVGDDGFDYISTGTGDDVVSAGSGFNIVRTGSGNDVVVYEYSNNDPVNWLDAAVPDLYFGGSKGESDIADLEQTAISSLDALGMGAEQNSSWEMISSVESNKGDVFLITFNSEQEFEQYLADLGMSLDQFQATLDGMADDIANRRLESLSNICIHARISDFENLAIVVKTVTELDPPVVEVEGLVFDSQTQELTLSGEAERGSTVQVTFIGSDGTITTVEVIPSIGDPAATLDAWTLNISDLALDLDGNFQISVSAVNEDGLASDAVIVEDLFRTIQHLDDQGNVVAEIRALTDVSEGIRTEWNSQESNILTVFSLNENGQTIAKELYYGNSLQERIELGYSSESDLFSFIKRYKDFDGDGVLDLSAEERYTDFGHKTFEKSLGFESGNYIFLEKTTEYHDEQFGIISKTIDARYNLDGTLLSINSISFDELGRILRVEYDYNGDGVFDTAYLFEYNGLEIMREEYSSGGTYHQIREKDEFGNLILESVDSSDEDRVKSWEYDATGQFLQRFEESLSSESNPLSNYERVITYDSMGNSLKDATTRASTGQTRGVEYVNTYDADGKIIQSLEYEALFDPVTGENIIQNPANYHRNEYTYDENTGLLQSVERFVTWQIDPDPIHWKYYDEQGRLLESMDEDGQYVKNTYLDDGTIILEKGYSPTEIQRARTYDAEGRTLEEKYDINVNGVFDTFVQQSWLGNRNMSYRQFSDYDEDGVIDKEVYREKNEYGSVIENFIQSSAQLSRELKEYSANNLLVREISFEDVDGDQVFDKVYVQDVRGPKGISLEDEDFDGLVVEYSYQEIDQDFNLWDRGMIDLDADGTFDEGAVYRNDLLWETWTDANGDGVKDENEIQKFHNEQIIGDDMVM